MEIMVWIIVGLLVLDAIGTFVMIGLPRKPITPGVAVFNAVLVGALVIGLIGAL